MLPHKRPGTEEAFATSQGSAQDGWPCFAATDECDNLQLGQQRQVYLVSQIGRWEANCSPARYYVLKVPCWLTRTARQLLPLCVQLLNRPICRPGTSSTFEVPSAHASQHQRTCHKGALSYPSCHKCIYCVRARSAQDRFAQWYLHACWYLAVPTPHSRGQH